MPAPPGPTSSRLPMRGARQQHLAVPVPATGGGGDGGPGTSLAELRP